MSALRVTPDFLAWLERNGVELSALNSPPVAWGYIALYERDRENEREAAGAPSGASVAGRQPK